MAHSRCRAIDPAIREIQVDAEALCRFERIRGQRGEIGDIGLKACLFMPMQPPTRIRATE
jgi:hypothetical protein